MTPATPMSVPITNEQLESTGGASAYSTIPVPSDQIATLKSVEDYDNTATGGKKGYLWVFDVLGLEFKVWTADTQAARFKLIEIVTSFDPSFFSGGESVYMIDPSLYVGMECAAHIGLSGKEGDEVRYREIKWCFPYVQGSEL